MRLAASRFSSAASFFGGHFFAGVVYISSVSFATRAKKKGGCVARLSHLSRDSSRVFAHNYLISSMRGLSPFAAFEINLGLFSTRLFFSFGNAFSCCSTHSWQKTNPATQSGLLLVVRFSIPRQEMRHRTKTSNIIETRFWLKSVPQN